MARKKHRAAVTGPFPRMWNIMNIEVDMDSVTVNGTVLYRPNHISRSMWMEFWEAVARIDA